MDFLHLYMMLLLAMAGYSSAAYCVCNTALSDSVLQKNIDYACGFGADCSQISPNGACFNPNTVKDHCNIAVNSYFQKKGQVQGSCDFSSTATVVQALPAGANSACFSSISTPTPPGMGTGTGIGTGTGTPGINLNPPIGPGPIGSNNFDSRSTSIHLITGDISAPVGLLVLGLIWFRLI
ncbi:hypothetical protein E3N88_44130 [Mikania micrantha]|uniref:X8 domain-containing protein n=1 Tax=Mikania micrantha TaxID=192012 RepID=A0A5N6LCX1_9ASTR|nr:hypothetical protein E3N88_45918 [Mikania micrantha]KAD0507636.1 hypothetical protein E3N88_44162 [Mikania micrantha]KAD0520628.1 hypothetical protein E3N88_44130 [Mikania micrantha]